MYQVLARLDACSCSSCMFHPCKHPVCVFHPHHTTPRAFSLTYLTVKWQLLLVIHLHSALHCKNAEALYTQFYIFLHHIFSLVNILLIAGHSLQVKIFKDQEPLGQQILCDQQ